MVLFNSPARPPRRRRPVAAPRFTRLVGAEALEDRSMPAVGVFDPVTGALVINSEPQPDGQPAPFERIQLTYDSATDEIVLSNFGVETQRFAEDPVTNITINAGARNSRVEVSPAIGQPTVINGTPVFAGVSVVNAGGGVTTITSGQTFGRLVASPNGGLVDAALGNSDIVAKPDTTPPAEQLQILSNGFNRIFGYQNTSVVIPTGPAAPRDFREGTAPPDFSQTLGLAPSPFAVLDPDEVNQLLSRASAATSSEDGIIAIVDRTGRILGVRIEGDVLPNLGLPDLDLSTFATLNDIMAALTPTQRYVLAFAVDGAVAKARTGAFFGNNQAPLTSRTIQNISQTTMTEREINAYPFDTNSASTTRGPGFVAPIGIKGHFPPGVPFTPQVDLFAIEHTNRDSSYHPGADNTKGTADDLLLGERFNADPTFVPQPMGQEIAAPDSYGYASGIAPNSQPRGIATLPGGIPIYKTAANGQPVVVGGIGVFYPGRTGFASEENSNLNENFDPTRPDRSLEAEFVAFAALGGAPLLSPEFAVPTVGVANLPPVPGIVIPITPQAMRIDLVGITLDIIGPRGTEGPQILRDFAIANYRPGVVSGFLAPLLDPNSGGGVADNKINPPAADVGIPQDPALNPFSIQAFVPQVVSAPSGQNGTTVAVPIDTALVTLLPGTFAPEGWLVLPHDSSTPGGLTADEVTLMVQQGIQQALITRAAIRLPLDRNAVMVFGVTDRTTGEILGLFRMPDSTIFSIDVAVAKARNVAYYADPALLQPIDQLPGVPPGAALTNRTFRFLALPRYPEGIDGRPPGPFSILNDGNVNPFNGTLVGPPAPASQFYTSVQGNDAFNPQTNFHLVPTSLQQVINRNGIVFFPGSSPTYKNGVLVGGTGISGDGVDQDDVVTFATVSGFQAPDPLRADMFFVRDVRLPYQKFNRQPLNP